MTLRCLRSGWRAERGIPQTGPPPNRCANVWPIVNEGNLLIGVSSEGERIVLRLDGELDLASVPTLENAMTEETLDGMAEIVLDLRGLEFIDSTGLRAILLQDKRSTERGQTFALVRGSEQVQRLLDLTHVDEHLKIVSSPRGDPPLAGLSSPGGGDQARRPRTAPPPTHLLSAVRAYTCAEPARRTTARASWPPPARRTARSSPPRRRPPGADVRAGRWSAPANSSLLMSLVLRSPPALLPLIAAVAVCDMAGENALVKWPNDVVLRQSDPVHSLAKLAGILTEGRPQAGWAVLGIGVNVAVRLEDLPGELRSGAATLGYPPEEIEPTLGRLLAALQRRLGEPTQTTLDAWRSRDALYGREIAWGSAGRGHAQGIDEEGRLIVVLADGGHTTLNAGEVHLRTIG